MVCSRAVLEMQMSDGLHEMGYPKWQLVVCILLVYTMLYVSLFKGVKSSGKVVWATATLPYVVLTILLIRGLMLPGAASGISYYLKPELSKLRETQVSNIYFYFKNREFNYVKEFINMDDLSFFIILTLLYFLHYSTLVNHCLV